MEYTNSALVSYKRISPNRDIGRTHSIDTISIHCVVGQCSVETLGSIFASASREASSNYGIGPDGRIGLYVEEKDRSWCTSSASNDNRAVTIEVASDTTHPYAVNDKAYAALIELLADICKRNGIKKLLWKGDKSLIGQVSKQNMTVHRWFANKSCPGDYLYNRHGAIADAVNKKLSASTYTSTSSKTTTNTISSRRPTIQYGSSGKYVSELQTDLNKLGYNCGSVDGGFGTNTLAAVTKFQTAKKLVVDGVVGVKTWAAIDASLKSASKSTASALKPYVVKVTANKLNIRKGAGTNYAIVGSIKDKGNYTIIQEGYGIGAKKWGKLKSGAGWISLDYTEKV